MRTTLLLRRSLFIRSRPGFSLAELLVALSIFALLSLGLLSNLHTGRQQDELRYEAEKIAATLRRAANQSLIGARVADPSGSGVLVPVKGGFGVEFRTSSNDYRVVADVDGDKTVNASKDVIAQPTTLPPGITMALARRTGSTPTVLSSTFIQFYPPKGVICDDDICAQCLVLIAPATSGGDPTCDLTQSSSGDPSLSLKIVLTRTGVGSRKVIVSGISGKVSVE